MPATVDRDAIVKFIAAILERGEPTRWAFEGACRAGLRSHRCLTGETWQDADDWAARIVKHALHRIGATVRPTWEMGQPDDREDLVERRFCVVCHGPLDAHGRRGQLYCSDACMSTGSNRSRMARMAEEKAVSTAAFQVAETRGEHLTRQCPQCERTFQVRWDYVVQKYCGQECANAAQIEAGTQRKRRICPNCGTEFQALHHHNKYCSHKCYTAAKRMPPRTCATCGSYFRPRHNESRYCSRHCMYQRNYATAA
jgi:hypothetical protein